MLLKLIINIKIIMFQRRLFSTGLSIINESRPRYGSNGAMHVPLIVNGLCQSSVTLASCLMKQGHFDSDEIEFFDCSNNQSAGFQNSN